MLGFIMEQDLEEPRNRVILVDNEVFKMYEYQREEELENRVSKLVKFVFGPEAIFFDVRQRVASKARKINVTDGILLELKKGRSKLWLVEFELSSHDLYSHVQPQIMGFIRSLRNPRTLRDVQLALYEEIQADEGKGKTLRGFLGPDKDVFYFLDQVLHQKRGILVVIDEITPQLMEICEDFARYAEVKVIEFKTYKKDDKEIYYFIPFTAEEEAVRVLEEEKKEIPDYRKSWEARLKWVNPDIRDLVSKLIERIEKELPGISHLPKYRWYYIYKGKSRRRESLFAVLLLSKRSVNVRIRVDPARFEDELGFTKRYKGWFFKTGERGFSIRSLEQLNNALELIKQAYDFAED